VCVCVCVKTRVLYLKLLRAIYQGQNIHGYFAFIFNTPNLVRFKCPMTVTSNTAK